MVLCIDGVYGLYLWIVFVGCINVWVVSIYGWYVWIYAWICTDICMDMCMDCMYGYQVLIFREARFSKRLNLLLHKAISMTLQIFPIFPPKMEKFCPSV